MFFYSFSTDLRPLPPSFLDMSSRYRCRSFRVISSIFSTMIFLPSRSSCWMFAMGQVCADIKYVNTGKAYWLDATTFAWSDNGLDKMIDSLCKYVFAAPKSYLLLWLLLLLLLILLFYLFFTYFIFCTGCNPTDSGVRMGSFSLMKEKCAGKKRTL